LIQLTEQSNVFYRNADCACQRPHCSENKHSTWRQEFLGRGSENLEQSTSLTAAAWHWIWTL